MTEVPVVTNSNASPTNLSRRRTLIAISSVVGAAAVGTVAVPFLASMTPSERAKAAGAPVEVDISKLQPGQMMSAEWRGKPVWIVRRTKEMLDTLPKIDSKVSDPKSAKPFQPQYAQNEWRSIKPEYLVVIGICSHLGCSPTEKFGVASPDMGPDWEGGFLCPCHGSRFDLAGRVFKAMPAPTNLEVAPYKYLTDTLLLIGEHTKTA